MSTSLHTRTNIQEIADGIYRINTPIAIPAGPGQFSFNQYLIVDDEPLLFHTGPRRLFTSIRDAVSRVIPVQTLRHIGLSHFEADECGALNLLLASSPHATPFCGRIAAMVSVGDFADREPRALADAEELPLGRRTVKWFDTPHVPHGWDCGLMMESTTRTFFCGDLFTQGGPGDVAVTEADILGPSEAFRKPMDYFAHAPQTRPILERLALEQPTTLACMHGSAWRGNGAALLTSLSRALA